MSIDYNKRTVVQLKELINERCIPPTGLKLKKQLVEALEQWDHQNETSDAPELLRQTSPEKRVPSETQESPATLQSDTQAAETTEDAPAEQSTQSKVETPSSGTATIDHAVPASVPSISQTPVPTGEEPIAGPDDRDTQPSVAPTLSRLTTEELAEENRKRKRRSATPPVGTAEAVQKKQKIDVNLGGAVHLKEDSDVDMAGGGDETTLVEADNTSITKPENVHDDGPRTQDTAGSAVSDDGDAEMDMDASDAENEAGADTAKIESQSKDDVPLVANTDSAELLKEEQKTKVAPQKEESPTKEEDKDTKQPAKTISKDARYKTLFSTDNVEPVNVPATDTSSREVTRALHPATPAIYIRNFMRPLQPQALRRHLIALASPPGSSPDDTLLKTFYLDPIRTHAFASFTSINAASRVRTALHDTIWPQEKTRKELFVDFILEEDIERWIEMEEDAAKEHGRMSRRWEVTYSDDKAFFGEAGSHGAPPPDRRPSNTSDFNPPTGPRNDYEQRRPSIHDDHDIHPSRRGLVQDAGPPRRAPAPPAPARARADNSGSQKSFVTLDKMFKKTAAKPMLYYVSAGDDKARKRLEELRLETSRDWDASIQTGEELRKFAFDGDDLVVDSGPLYRAGGNLRGGWRGRGRGRGRGA